MLPERDVDGGWLFAREARIGHVGDDADDLPRLRLGCMAPSPPGPIETRIAWPSGSWPGKWRSANVLLMTATHGVEAVSRSWIIRPRSSRIPSVSSAWASTSLRSADGLLAGFGRRPADDGERMRPDVERQPADDAGTRDARQGAHPLEQLIVEHLDLRRDQVHVLRRLVEVLRAAEQDVGRQQPRGIEAGQIALLAQEAAHHQAGADEQHHRQRHLRDQEHAAAAGALAARSARRLP